MVQKWNLGDIVPPDRERRASRPSASSSHSGMSDMRRSAPGEHASHNPRPAHPFENNGRQLPHNEPEHSRGEETLDEEVHDLEIQIGRKSRFKRYALIFSVLLFAIGAGVGSTILMSGADVTVMPKVKSVTVNGALEAKKNPRAGELGYEILSFEENGERTVSATGQEKVSERASGTITISNTYSTTKQRLVKNTRFESPDGLIFRITDSVEIPGYTKGANGAIVPGTATAKVLADGTGEQYNIKATTFTVPGLKGSEQFEKVTGVSKEAMTGGFEGMKFIINEGELSKARQELHLELREKLFARLKAEKPNGFVFYDPSVTFVFNSLPPVDAGDQSVTIKEQARLMAPLFKTDAFASFVAKRAVPGYEGEPVRLENSETLAFSYPVGTTSDISTAESIEFNLDGQVKVIWVYDAEKLRNDLRGAAQTALPAILSGYPAIEKSKAVIKPFWKDSFPSDIEKIEITESFETFE